MQTMQQYSEQLDRIEPTHHQKEAVVVAVEAGTEEFPLHKQQDTTAINYMGKPLTYSQGIVPRPRTLSHNGTYTGASTATITSLLTCTPDQCSSSPTSRGH
jgi:hypothetical protein